MIRWRRKNRPRFPGFGSLLDTLLGPVKKGTKANGSKIPQGEEWTHR